MTYNPLKFSFINTSFLAKTRTAIRLESMVLYKTTTLMNSYNPQDMKLEPYFRS